jgi:hypothetical protein
MKPMPSESFLDINTSRHGLIFMPDITGFTRFIHDTEIKHSQHIISELLELITHETEPYFVTSEIEGDAVLSYRFGNDLNLETLIILSEKIFVKFHQHLKFYDRDRICDCGACTYTKNLSLKFIIHFGNITVYKVGKHEKLLGNDIIIAHRLLKNQLSIGEYILFSENAVKNIPDSTRLFLQFEKVTSRFEGVGELGYYFKSLIPLLSDIPQPPERFHEIIPEFQATSAVLIQSDMRSVLDAIVEPEQRIKWVKNLKKVDLIQHKINRVKSQHECLIGQNQVEVTLEDLISKDDEIKLLERAEMKNPKMTVKTGYSLKKINHEQIEITQGILIEKGNNQMLNFLSPMVSYFMSKSNYNNLIRLKSFVEMKSV